MLPTEIAKRAQPHAVGDVIRHYRRAKNLTQAQLGMRIDANREYISMLESGKSYPSLIQFIRIALALDVNPGEMVNNLVDRIKKFGCE